MKRVQYSQKLSVVKMISIKYVASKQSISNQPVRSGIQLKYYALDGSQDLKDLDISKDLILYYCIYILNWTDSGDQFKLPKSR